MFRHLPSFSALLFLTVVSFAGVAPARADAPPAFTDDGAALPKAAELERLARDKPLAFLENCLRRYLREVKGYSLTMEKQERMNGNLNPREVIEVHFRDKPHSVYMNWQEGARRAERALYVEGENNGMMLARPAGKAARFLVGDVVSRDPEGDDARQSGRYSLKEYGIKKGTERTLAGWKAAQEKGTLKVEYLGVKKIKEVGDRECHVLRRNSKEPWADGSIEATIYVDTENWLQVGSVIKGENDQVIGIYYFRNIRLNPEFKDRQFQRAALIP